MMMVVYRIIRGNGIGHPPSIHRLAKQQVSHGGVCMLSISCMDGCVHAHVHAWMGFGTGHPSVNDASAYWGRA